MGNHGAEGAPCEMARIKTVRSGLIIEYAIAAPNKHAFRGLVRLFDSGIGSHFEAARRTY